MKIYNLVVALLTVSLVAGCGVPRKEHDALKQQLEQRNAEYAELEQENADLEEAMQSQIATLDNRIAALESRRDELQAELDEANATISMYESETGGLQKALKVTKQDIEMLRKQRAAALARLREYRQLAKRLASMIESGQLSVKVRNSKMVIELANAILFDPGKTKLKEEGKEALQELAGVLQTVEDRTFLIAGHTDNVPIQVSGFESNWELSTARAVKVLHLLQSSGVEPQKLAAAGFGEFDPVASNETDQGRAQNRRTEIVLMPKIDELPEIPEDVFEKESS